MRNNGAMSSATRADSTSPQKGRRRGTFWLGIVLVLGALSVLGYAAWEQWGTNLGSWQAHKRIVQEVEKQWSGEVSGTGDTPVTVGEDVVALIRIPRFGLSWVIRLSALRPDVLALQSPSVIAGQGPIAGGRRRPRCSQA